MLVLVSGEVVFDDEELCEEEGEDVVDYFV